MVYADYNGSAPISTAVTDYLKERFSQGEYSNPNATHALGKKMLFKMEDSRRSLARVLGCRPHQITFNSGSSEGISHIFHSLLSEEQDKKIIVTSEIEHMAITQACEYYKSKGFQTVHIETTNDGQIDLENFKEILKQHQGNIAFVTIIAANNETGIIQPFIEVGKQCREREIIFFSDTTQYIGKTDFKFDESYMDFAVSSSHKIGAMIGSGIIISRDPSLLRTHIFGGGQENGKRGGTQNYLAIETMGIAIESFDKNKGWLKQVNSIRVKFEESMQKKFPELVIIGDNSPRLASTTMVAFPGLPGQVVQAQLETDNVFVTTSSACSDAKKGNRILEAMGLDDKICQAVIRVSLCMNSNQALYDRIEVALTNAYNKLKEVYKL